MDYETIELLKSQDHLTLESIAEPLLEWIQDINWPIAQDIIEILIPLDTKLIPSIRNVLNSNDFEWIYNCLNFLVSRLSLIVIKQLKSDLKNLEVRNQAEILEYEIPNLVEKILCKLQ